MFLKDRHYDFEWVISSNCKTTPVFGQRNDRLLKGINSLFSKRMSNIY